MRKNLSLIGAATDLGQKKAGTELAPSWMRLKGMGNTLTRKFFSVTDIGDLTPLHQPTQRGKDHQAIAIYNKRLMEVCREGLNKDQTVLTLGGDHSIAIGTLSASLLHNPDTKVVWVDAHADLNTPETSPSGNVHGMPLAFFFGLVNDSPMAELFSWVPKLKKENLVYIGLRDVDQGEREFIKSLGITSYYAEDVLEMGIDKVLAETKVQLFPNGDEAVHLSFDVDGLDPRFIPATGTPVDGGLHLLDGQKIIHFLATQSELISFDLVEVNPMLGTTQQELETTEASVLNLLESLPAWNELDLPLNEMILRRTVSSSEVLN